MNWFSNIKLSQKISLISAFSFIFITSISAISIYCISKSAEETKTLYQTISQELFIMEELQGDFKNLKPDTQQMLLFSDNPDFVKDSQESVPKWLNSVDEKLQQYSAISSVHNAGT